MCTVPKFVPDIERVNAVSRKAIENKRDKWCREGCEPPRGCPRRILSQFLGILHGFAPESKRLHNHLIMSSLRANFISHWFAPKCTIFVKEQPPKQPPRRFGGFFTNLLGFSCLRVPLGGCFGGCFQLQTTDKKRICERPDFKQNLSEINIVLKVAISVRRELPI